MGKISQKADVNNPLELAEEPNGKGQPSHFGAALTCKCFMPGRSSVGRELFLGCCTVISAVNDLLVEELDLEKRRAYTTRHITWHLFTYLKLHCIFIFNDHLEVVSLNYGILIAESLSLQDETMFFPKQCVHTEGFLR